MGDYSRQEKLIPLESVKGANIMVIGVGAVGRNVALGLAKMGARTVSLVDPQSVGPENVSNQGYTFSQVGDHKVWATIADMKHQHPDEDSEECKFEAFPDYWHKRCKAEAGFPDYTFVCVDSITIRKEIFDDWKTWVLEAEEMWPRYLFDTRMFGETMRVLSVTDEPESLDAYEQTLFGQDEAFGGGCVVPGSYPYSQITAGLVLHQFVRALRDEEVCPQLVMDLKGDEMYPAMARAN